MTPLPSDRTSVRNPTMLMRPCLFGWKLHGLPPAWPLNTSQSMNKSTNMKSKEREVRSRKQAANERSLTRKRATESATETGEI